jgi:ribonuclease Z
MDVVLLGTGFPIPDADRAGPATLVRVAGMNLLFDAGRALLMRLRGAGCGPNQVHHVFLTHLHSDHICDFNDLLTMHWATNLVPQPLPVIGPAGTQRFVDDTLTMLGPDIEWRIEHHEDLTWEPDVRVTEAREGVVFDQNGVRVIAAPTLHLPVKDTIGFRIEHAGKVVVIGGDSVPCDGLDQLCAGADVYVQTVLRRPLIEQIPAHRLREILNYHSSTEDAAQTAARAGVRTLVYTHMMPGPTPGTEQDWINDAKPHFDGEVILGDDLQRIVV